jgi:hypothetical protein
MVPTELPTSFTSREIRRIISGETIPKHTNGGNTKQRLDITIPTLRFMPSVADIIIEDVKGMIVTKIADAKII